MVSVEDLERYTESVQKNFVDAFPYVRDVLEKTDNTISPNQILTPEIEVNNQKVEQTLFVMEREGALNTPDYTEYQFEREELDLESWQETYEKLRSRHSRPVEKEHSGKNLEELAEEYFS